MSNTGYQDYTSRAPSPKSKSRLSFWAKFWRIFIGVVAIIGLVLMAGWWLKTRLAEVFMVKQPVTVVWADPQPGSQVGLWIFQLQPDAKKILWVNLAAETQTELFSGYGKYSVASVYPLLKLDKKSPAYIQASLGAIVGRLIDRLEPWSELKNWQQRVLAIRAQTVVQPNSVHQRLASAPILAITSNNWHKIWSNNLSFSERRQLFLDWQTSLGWYWFTQQDRLKWQWSDQLSDLIATAPKPAADCQIAVVNASQSQGLAKQISTLLTNTGYEIIRISAEATTLETSALWLDPNRAENCRVVALSVAGAIPTTPSLKLDAEIAARYRAPIVLMVGLDNAK